MTRHFSWELQCYKFNGSRPNSNSNFIKGWTCANSRKKYSCDSVTKQTPVQKQILTDNVFLWDDEYLWSIYEVKVYKWSHFVQGTEYVIGSVEIDDAGSDVCC